MVQAARSGMQMIAEGSRASPTSSQTELRLVKWHTRVSMSYCSATKTFCASGGRSSGEKMIPRRGRCGSCARLAKEPKPGLNFGDVRATRTENNVRSVTLCELRR